MTTHTSEERLRQIAMQQMDLWNAHDVDGLVSCYTDDVRWSTPAKSGHGKASAGQNVRETLTAFPDLRFDPAAIETFCNADATAVVFTWSATGTMTGPLEGVPPTGRSGTLTGMTLARMEGELISENHTVYDGLEYLQKIGFLPASDSVSFKALVMGEVMAGKAWHAVQEQIARRRSRSH